MLMQIAKIYTLLVVWLIWIGLAISKKRNSDIRFIYFSVVPVMLSLMLLGAI